MEHWLLLEKTERSLHGMEANSCFIFQKLWEFMMQEAASPVETVEIFANLDGFQWNSKELY